ncbi:Retrotransposon gag protein [Popillia japonica]|uniref:Retrotransposon gag protein n=1 Tax=Popillia japonica TaxID=7064 RepID=A0AAW1IDG9_POPJA
MTSPVWPQRGLEAQLDVISRCLGQTTYLTIGGDDISRLAAALKSIIDTTPVQAPPPRKFSGQLVEDPSSFLEQLEAHLQGQHLEIPEDIDYAVLPHLTGEAAIWYGRNEASFLSFEEFKRRFKAKFLGPGRHKKLWDATEAQQDPEEPVAVFVHRMRRLCLQYSPNWPEADLVDHIIAKMTDRYCVPIAQANLRTLEELLQQCDKWTSLFEHGTQTTEPPRTSQDPASRPVQGQEGHAEPASP